MCWEGPKGPIGILPEISWIKNDPKNGKSPKKWAPCLFAYKIDLGYEAAPKYGCATGYKKNDSIWVHNRDCPDPVPDEDVICWVLLPTEDELDHLYKLFGDLYNTEEL